jgi:hypothetical protein
LLPFQKAMTLYKVTNMAEILLLCFVRNTVTNGGVAAFEDS